MLLIAARCDIRGSLTSPLPEHMASGSYQHVQLIIYWSGPMIVRLQTMICRRLNIRNSMQMVTLNAPAWVSLVGKFCMHFGFLQICGVLLSLAVQKVI